MKKIIIVIITFFLLKANYLNGQVNNCNPLTTIRINTGIDAAGINLATTGIIDPYWNLTNVAPPSINGSGGINIPNAYTIVSGHFASWCNIPGVVSLNVIPNNSFNVNNTNPAQPWHFRRKFSITTNGSVTIAGRYISDDACTLRICDALGNILFTDNQAGWSVIKNFSTTLNLNEGCYYMQIELKNIGGGMMGYAVEANVTAATAIVANPSQNCCNGTIISGQKWIDKNCDGIINSGDVPGVGWTINLLNGSTLIQSTTTDAFGQYYFNNIAPGIYTVSEVSQVGFIPKNPISGSQLITVSNAISIYLQNFLNCENNQPCQCGNWVSTPYTLNGVGNTKFNCNNPASLIINANQGDLFSATPQFICNDANGQPSTNCNATIKYDIYFPKGTVLLNQTSLAALNKLDSCGNTRVLMKATCGGVVCPNSCEFSINVNCCKCAQTFSPYLYWDNGTTQDSASIACGSTKTNYLDCNKKYTIKVKNPCGVNCPTQEVDYTITYPNGDVQTTTSFAGMDMNVGILTGDYIVEISATCNGIKCPPCKIIFKQTKICQPVCNNCKDKVQATFNSGASTVAVAAHPAASTLNASFYLDGGTDTYTEVRANIVDVQISSGQYVSGTFVPGSAACLQCYNNANNWGSIVGGTLTGFTSTITSYTGVNATNLYNNPREAVFTTTTPTALPFGTALNLTFKIPGISTISCCCITVKAFVKITYRNNKCEECSKVVLIDVTQCPGGGTTSNGGVGTATFNLSGHPQFKIAAPTKGNSVPVNFENNIKNNN
jgi:hypothetical protein